MKYEIWLGDCDTYFEKGIAYLEDGSTAPLTVFVNVGNYQDSVIIGNTSSVGDVDEGFLRWYPKVGVIECYLWIAPLDRIVFHNGASQDIYIAGYAYLKPGERAELQKGVKHDYASLHRRMNIIGLGRFASTSHQEAEYQDMVGKVGVIASRMSRTDFSKDVLRFILADCFCGAEPETEGFETDAGTLEYAGKDRMIFRTEKSEYVFEHPSSKSHEALRADEED